MLKMTNVYDWIIISAINMFVACYMFGNSLINGECSF